jgi:ATP-dependent Zn protease
MGFIFAIFIFILFIGLFILLSVVGFLRSIFNFGKKKNPLQDQQSEEFKKPAGKSKIFDKKEGEYVDYEELEK